MSQLRTEFKRTECSCEKCQAGCKTQPASLGPGEAREIARYLQIEKGEFLDFLSNKFCASDGSRAVILGRPVTIPSIVPQQKDNGECVFFEDGRCSIHPVKPFGCGWFDVHMEHEEADKRIKSQMLATMIDDEHKAQWEFLMEENKVARPIMERKAAFRKLLIQIEEKESKTT